MSGWRSILCSTPLPSTKKSASSMTVSDRINSQRLTTSFHKPVLKQQDDDVGIKHQARKSLHPRPPRQRTSSPPTAARPCTPQIDLLRSRRSGVPESQAIGSVPAVPTCPLGSLARCQCKARLAPERARSSLLSPQDRSSRTSC